MMPNTNRSYLLAFFCLTNAFATLAQAEKRPSIPSGDSVVFHELVDKTPRRALRYKKHLFSIHAGGGATQSSFSLNGNSRSYIEENNDDSMTTSSVNFALGYKFHFNPRIRLESDLSYALNPDDQSRLNDQIRVDFRNQVRGALLMGFRVYKSNDWRVFTSIGAGVQSYTDLQVVEAGPGVVAKLEVEYSSFSMKFSPYYFRHNLTKGDEIHDYDLRSGSYIDQYGADLSAGWIKRF